MHWKTTCTAQFDRGTVICDMDTNHTGLCRRTLRDAMLNSYDFGQSKFLICGEGLHSRVCVVNLRYVTEEDLEVPIGL